MGDRRAKPDFPIFRRGNFDRRLICLKGVVLVFYKEVKECFVACRVSSEYPFADVEEVTWRCLVVRGILSDIRVRRSVRFWSVW